LGPRSLFRDASFRLSALGYLLSAWLSRDFRLSVVISSGCRPGQLFLLSWRMDQDVGLMPDQLPARCLENSRIRENSRFSLLQGCHISPCQPHGEEPCLRNSMTRFLGRAKKGQSITRSLCMALPLQYNDTRETPSRLPLKNTAPESCRIRGANLCATRSFVGRPLKLLPNGHHFFGSRLPQRPIVVVALVRRCRSAAQPGSPTRRQLAKRTRRPGIASDRASA
jgi:hypothetical protein